MSTDQHRPDALPPVGEDGVADIRDIPVSLPSLAKPDNTPLAPCDLPTTSQLIADWLSDLADRIAHGQRAEVTGAVYARSIRPWLAFLADEARTDHPTPATVHAFQGAAFSRGLKPATVNLLIATVSSLYRYAERHDRYPAIARSLERIREWRDGPLPSLTHEQILAIRSRMSLAITSAETALHTADPKPRDGIRLRLTILRRDRALLGILYSTAVRLVSLERANTSDVDLTARTLRHQPKRHRAKDAVSYLAQSATDDLAAYLQDRQRFDDGAPEMPLFQAHDRRMAGNRLTTRSMSRIILNHLIASGHVACEVGKPGTPGRVRQPRQLSAHGIRRSSARRIVEKYGLEVARELLQHASVETTRRAYARIKQDTDLRRAAEDLGS